MINVNDFKGLTDNEIIENAIKNRDSDGTVLIPPRDSDIEPERNWWSLDRAILIPENTTIILRNCKIKLSDKCRDNFFRTANCGMGIAFPKKIRNVHIKGEGLCILEGADHPRATGDGSKVLANPCPYTDEDGKMLFAIANRKRKCFVRLGKSRIGAQMKELFMLNNDSSLKRSRLMYIFEAALEYLISILVAGSFLATITKELGISDSLTGILSSVISLGCLFQLLSLTIRKAKVKKLVVILSVVNQALFMLLYVIPLTGAKKQIKIVLFVVLICAAYLIYNFAHPKKINWLMSLVDDSSRGAFTANKEIVSLVCGMLFSFLMGAVIDRFAESGQIRTAFILSAAVIFMLMLLHTLTLIFTVEKETPDRKNGNFLTGVKDLVKNKNVLKITGVFVLYNISNFASVPFYGTYQINELALSLKTVSVLVILGNISRILVSRLWGKYADRKSFAAMTEKCLIFLGVAQLCALFAVPKNGALMFALYYFFYGVAMGGINSALINLIFDYVAPEKRSDSLAITQAVSGVVGFLTTVCLSPLVTLVQKSNDTIFGVHIYAQQLCTLISLLFTALSVIYVKKVIIGKGLKY